MRWYRLANAGSIKGEKGDTGVKGDTGDKGSTDIVPNEKKVMLEQVPMLMLIMKVES